MTPRARRAALAALLATLATAALAAGDLPRSGSPRPAPKRERPAEAWTRPESAVLADPGSEPLAIVGADVHPVTRRPIESGTLLLKDGRILAVQPSGARIPDGFRVIDGRGLQAWPGWVAIGGEGLGLSEDAWAGGPEAILARGIGESFDPWSDQVELASSAGITTMLTWRNSGLAKGPLSGRAAILKMSPREPRGALVNDAAAAVASAALLGPEGRRAAREAVEAARKGRDRGRGDGPPDAKAELWRAVAGGRAPILSTFDSAADLLSLADLAEELDLRLLLVTPAEAWPLAKTLCDSGRVSVSQNVRTTWGKPREDRRGNVPGGARFDAVRVLRDAGCDVAVAPDPPTISPWGVAGRDLLDLPLEAAFAVRAGLSEAEAVEAITIVPARILGIDDRVGSLEAGKDADVILLDGDPLDYRTLVRVTIVNGRVVHEAAKSRFWHGVARRRDEALRDRRQQP